MGLGSLLPRGCCVPGSMLAGSPGPRNVRSGPRVVLAGATLCLVPTSLRQRFHVPSTGGRGECAAHAGDDDLGAAAGRHPGGGPLAGASLLHLLVCKLLCLRLVATCACKAGCHPGGGPLSPAAWVCTSQVKRLVAAELIGAACCCGCMPMQPTLHGALLPPLLLIPQVKGATHPELLHPDFE